MPFPYTFPFVLGVLDPSPMDHEEEAAARVITAYKGTSVETLIRAAAGSIQSIEDKFWPLRSKRTLALAEGDQLDGLGSIVGERRAGGNDIEYRARIRARIRLNRSGGRTEDVYGVIGLLLPTGYTQELREEYPAGFRLIVTGGDVPNVATIARMLQETKGAGVRGMLLATNETPANTFTLDGAAGQGLDEGVLADLLE